MGVQSILFTSTNRMPTAGLLPWCALGDGKIFITYWWLSNSFSLRVASGALTVIGLFGTSPEVGTLGDIITIVEWLSVYILYLSIGLTEVYL